ncbi:CotH kinase family protein [Rubrivirga sp.]|uniref:CotH kinase family protein n=1 Tax=Rubrivirga sp. TaxID=1885344 RepID=UPI003C78028B
MRFLFLALVLAVPAFAQSVSFTSSNLPIVLIDTDAQEIPDEPKIMARMQIIDNGPSVRNAVTDAPNDYDGFIGIERRGSTSQAFFPKKQYGVELWDADGDDIDASLLGMPTEEDWILQAPYSDKTLMRNVLAYGLARRLGQYASRTRFCEVVLNGEYQGVYVLMEKLKRDDERIDINNLKDDEVEGDDLTGGYIFKLDKTTGSGGDAGWTSPYPSPSNASNPVRYLFEDPDADDIVPEQVAYISGFMTDFENAMASDSFQDEATGYPAYIDLDSFIDFYLVNEVAKNVDGYRLSSFFYKDKDSNDPLLHAGPVWDFNLAFGNANYYSGEDPTGFQVDFLQSGDPFPIPFWWPKLVESDGFRVRLQDRWTTLRQGLLHTDSLMAEIDANVALLDEAQARNFQRWPILGEYVWPNVYANPNATYADVVGYMKGWLRDRMAWLDAEIRRGTSTPPSLEAGFSISTWPNPSSGAVRIEVDLDVVEPVTVEVLDVRGRRVLEVWDGPLADGAVLEVETSSLSSGVYVVRATTAAETATRRLAIVR